MTRYVCMSCNAANYSTVQNRETVKCWKCGGNIIERRQSENFSANEILEDIKHIAKETMYYMDLAGMKKCDIMSRISENIDDEYC